MRLLNQASIKMLLMGIVTATLFAFSAHKGGDHYEIYMNKKLILREYVHNSNGVKNFELDSKDYNGQLAIYYSHCGKLGKVRSIAITNAENKVLKQWQFEDAASNVFMICKVKDIMELQKNNNKLNLYYSSKELPKGKLLASITLRNDNNVMP